MIAYITSWSFYWVGHLLSKVYELTWIEAIFDAYHWCMTKSVNIQDRYDVENGPWIAIDEEEIDLNSSDKM